MKVTFSAEFHKYTDSVEELTVSGSTVCDALHHVFLRFPQLLVHLSENAAYGATTTSLQLNEEYIYDTQDAFRCVEETDVLKFSKDIPEGESKGLRIAIGVALIVAAVVAAPFTGGASLTAAAGFSFGTGGAFVAMMGASLVLGGLSEMLAPSPKLPGDATSSPTYSFNGIQNTTATGTPISIVYGTHRVGGHVINVYTSIKAADQEYLLAQIALSEGEIESVSNIQINKRDSFGFKDVYAIWRSGTSSQLPPGGPIQSDSKVSYSTHLFASYTIMDQGGGILIPSTNPIDSVSVTGWVKGDGTYYCWLETAAGVKLVQPYWQPTPSGCGSYVTAFGSTLCTRPQYTHTFNFPAYTGDIYIKVQKYNSNCDFYEWGIISYTTHEPTVADNLPIMSGFSEIYNSIAVGGLITPEVNNTGGVQVTTTVETTHVLAVISAPAMTNNGNGAGVDFQVGYRPSGSSNDYTLYINPKTNTTTFRISHPSGTKSEIFQVVDIQLPSSDYWDIVVYRLTSENLGNNISLVDDIYFKEIVEYLHSGLLYPHTALLGIRALAQGQLDGSMPTITSLVKGIKVAVPTGYLGEARAWAATWNGTMKSTKEWTDNPVWCLYDLITNERYGFGKYFRIAPEKHSLMLANFVTMANYCDQRVNENGDFEPANSYEMSVSGKVLVKPVTLGTDPSIRNRFSLNLVIDQSKSAIEWLNIICASMRASLYYSEGCLYLDIDRPKNISQLFTMSSIANYTQSSSSKREVPNTYEVQFMNMNKDYEPTSLLVEDIDLQADYSVEARTKTLQLYGATDPDQVRSLSKYALYAGKYARTAVSFTTGTTGLGIMIGDVIGIQHDVPMWGAGGKIAAWNGTTMELTLDQPFLYQWSSPGVPYQYHIFIQKPGSEPTYEDVYTPDLTGYSPEELTDIYTNGLSSSLVIFNPVYEEVDLQTVPEAGLEYVITTATNGVKQFRVTSLSRTADESVSITAIEYNESLYSACDDIRDIGGVSEPIFITAASPVKIPVSNVVLEEELYYSPTGQLKNSIVVNYSVPSGSYWVGARAWYGNVEGTTLNVSAIDSTGKLVIPDVPELGVYIVTVVSEYKDGSQQSYQTCASDTSLTKEITLLGKMAPPDAPTNLHAVTQDRWLKILWDMPGDIDLAGFKVKVGRSTWGYDDEASNGVDVFTLGNVSSLLWAPNQKETVTFMVKAFDTSGNYSTLAQGEKTIIGPSFPITATLTPQVVDNNVLLFWSSATSNDYPIEHYDIYKGNTNVVDDWILVGEKSGTFTTVFETVPNQYKYWLVAVDSAGLTSLTVDEAGEVTGGALSVYATVAQPPDFILRSNEYLSPNWVGTKDGCFIESDGSLTCLVDTSEYATWSIHFTGLFWESPADQVVNFPYYGQPGVASAYYEETIDYGAEISSSKIVMDVTRTVPSGTVAITPKISVKLNIGDAWTDYADVYEVYATSFRYVKYRLDFVSTSNNGYGVPTGLVNITRFNVRLESKLKTFEGQTTAVSTDTDGTIVYLTSDRLPSNGLPIGSGGNRVFMDVSSIQVSCGVDPTLNHKHIGSRTLNNLTEESGTYSDTITDDATNWVLAEVNGVGGDVEMNFSGCASSSSVVFKAWYANNHTGVVLQAWDYVGATWVTHGTFLTNQTSAQVFGFFLGAQYTSAGAIKLRIYHPTNGVSSHRIYVQYVEISNTVPDTAIYSFIDEPSPEHMHLFRFNQSGDRVDGQVSWTVRGV